MALVLEGLTPQVSSINKDRVLRGIYIEVALDTLS
jgi:hypothetical protein